MNRKNSIGKYVLILSAVVIITALANWNHRLQEALVEKEKVISDIGKTVDTLTKENKELENNLINVGQENATLKEANAQLTQANAALTDENDVLKNDKEKLLGDLSTLQDEVKQLRKKTETVIVSRGDSVAKTIYVEATAYTAYCSGCSGKTATGQNLRANPNLKVIAVDPRVVPLGSKVWVEGYGYAIAGDTGGAIKGYKVDIFMANLSDAYKWGRKTVQLKILN